MIKLYPIDSPVRARYYELNNIKHVEIWQENKGYSVALCRDDMVGTREYWHETKRECTRFINQYIPDLPYKGVTYRE